MRLAAYCFGLFCLGFAGYAVFGGFLWTLSSRYLSSLPVPLAQALSLAISLLGFWPAFPRVRRLWTGGPAAIPSGFTSWRYGACLLFMPLSLFAIGMTAYLLAFGPSGSVSGLPAGFVLLISMLFCIPAVLSADRVASV